LAGLRNDADGLCGMARAADLMASPCCRPGRGYFHKYGCDTATNPTKPGKGPSLNGVFGKPQKLKDGRTLMVDETFIRQAITNPNSMPLENYSPVIAHVSRPAERRADS